MTNPSPAPRLDTDAVRRVAALITAELHTPVEKWETDPVLRAAWGDALYRATACMPFCLHVIRVLINDLAEAQHTTPAALWQARATTAAALYENGDGRG